jgi:hypothetical protein
MSRESEDREIIEYLNGMEKIKENKMVLILSTDECLEMYVNFDDKSYQLWMLEAVKITTENRLKQKMGLFNDKDGPKTIEQSIMEYTAGKNNKPN